ncbi:MAG: Na(+)-translocating NADH-quinone reductase subunit C [Hyphomicrobiales bacterium]|nr:MAG: Na(+)-translocating NADH-quinone reductase subunit C [Hyphomicrobiales bacterium]
MSDQDTKLGAWAKFKALPIDSTPKTLLVAFSLCLFCSMIVSGAAVYLKPVQEANKALDKKKNVLQVAGLYSPDVDIDEVFKQIEIKIVDLKTGRYTDVVNAQTYDQKAASKDPSMSIVLTNDPASIKRQAKYASVYIVPTSDGSIDKIILPIHGYGLWSTLYGFIAIKSDGNEIAGLQFYEQGETPGLGAEVDNPIWRAKWPGQKVYGDDGKVKISVSKNPKPAGEAGRFHVDALAGATLTSRGVDNLVKFWMGEQGFKLFLDNLKNGSL